MSPSPVTGTSLEATWNTPPEGLFDSPEEGSPREQHRRGPGKLNLVAERGNDGLTRLAQSRSKIPLAIQRRISPNSTGEPGRVCVVTPGGGHLAGDRLEKSLHCRSGSYLRVEDTGMQRVYGMKPGKHCRQTVSITVESGACLEWLPGPVIPYDNSAFHEYIELDLHEDSSLFVPFFLVPGRLAHGEKGGYRYYGKRLMARNTSKKQRTENGFHGIRFSDSFTAGTSVGFSPEEPVLTLYMLLENEDQNPELIEELRGTKNGYETLTGGISLLPDESTLVISASSPEWGDLVDFVADCYVQFRKAVKFSTDPSPFLFSAG